MNKITVDSAYFKNLYNRVNSDQYNNQFSENKAITHVDQLASFYDTNFTTYIHNKLISDGYIIVSVGNYDLSNIKSWLTSFLGPIMRDNDKGKSEFSIIAPQKDGKYFANSSHSQPIHTDEGHTTVFPRYVGLYCKTQAKLGGYSTLVLFQRLYDALVEEFGSAVNELFKKEAITVENVYGKQVKNLLCKLPDKRIGITYSPVLQQLICSETIFAMYHFITEYIHNVDHQIRFKLKDGDLLLFDNCRVLHGRTGFPDHEQRLLYRMWFTEIYAGN